VRLAADANVLLSAFLGGRERLVLESPQVDEILTVEQVMAEHAPRFSHRRSTLAGGDMGEQCRRHPAKSSYAISFITPAG
jgi:hypothetical protein